MTRTEPHKHRRWPLVAAGILALLFVLAAAYVMVYYHADPVALEALRSSATVEVRQTDYGWHFDGPSTEDVLVFYAGAKVEETAYAPLLHELADEGMDVCLLRTPFRIAFLAPNAADDALREHDYAHWYVGGHSMGGVVASQYGAAHASELDGVVLLAAYPNEQVPDTLRELRIYGSNDTVLNAGRYEESKQYSSPDCVEHIIEGGNHAQFGNYGVQAGDGQATITAVEQQHETASFVLDHL